MTEKKRGLGRGLTALFGDQKENIEIKKNVTSQKVVLIGDLNRNRFQPRINFNEDKIQELSLSIKKNGITKLIRPIIANQCQSFEKASTLIFLK